LIRLLLGDNRVTLKQVATDSADSVVTDPPYELGFMGKGWDASGIAYDASMWREVLRVLKPGGWLLAFSGSRTYHRMVCAIEDAGFEVRDQIMWLYGSGFPKSHNLEGGSLTEGMWGTALKPAHEPICVARKPLIGTVLANMTEHGTGMLNIDGCRVPASDADRAKVAASVRVESEHDSFLASTNELAGQVRDQTLPPGGRWPANVIHDGSPEVVDAFPHTKSGDARAVVRNGSTDPRVFGAMGPQEARHYRGPSEGSAARFFYCAKATRADREEGLDDLPEVRRTDGRKTEKHVPNLRTTARRNHHPTVKPTDLMRYLCRLVTPPGGVVLDPFMGSGSTGKAATLEGFQFVGCELNRDYIEIASRRISAALEET
jgi:site-specific DNA-methyltransferase (adenine-specific)